MLVQFKMKNVLSFKEETIFDMTAISAYKEHPSNLIDIDTKEKFLRVAAIYGAKVQHPEHKLSPDQHLFSLNP